jgi:hypothetical protein
MDMRPVFRTKAAPERNCTARLAARVAVARRMRILHKGNRGKVRLLPQAE